MKSKSNSRGRLSISSLWKNSAHKNQLERYDKIIQDQIKDGIVEKVDEAIQQEIAEGEKMFYLPHRLVVRASGKQLRIVYDASSKPAKNCAFLNDCLEIGPALQNSVWDILVRSRFTTILLSCDIERAF